ncbi:MAG: ATP-binding protein [Acidimicrobiales bacterium]
MSAADLSATTAVGDTLSGLDRQSASEPASRIVLLYLLFGIAFLTVTGALVGTSGGSRVTLWVASTLLFLALSGILLAVLVRLELRRRRVAEARLAELDGSLAALGLVSTTIAELHHDALLESLLRRVAEALDVEEVVVRSEDGSPPVAAHHPSRVAAGRSASGPDRPPDGGRSSTEVALQVEGRTIGSLAVVSRPGRRFGSGRDTQLLGIVASRLAAALEQRRLFRSEHQARTESERARQRLELAVQVTTRLAPVLDRADDALAEIAGLVAPAFADLCVIQLRDRDRDGLRLAAARGRRRGDAGAISEVLPPHGPAATRIADVIASRRTERLADVASEREADPLADALHRLGVVSALVIPLFVRDTTFGALICATSADRPALDADDAAGLEELGARIATTLERVGLHAASRAATREAEQRAAQLARVTKAITAVNVGLRPAAIVRVAADHACQVLDATAAEILVDLVDGSRLRATAPEDDPEPAALTGGDAVSATIDGRIGGSIRVGGKRSEVFTAHDESILGLFAYAVSIALANATLYADARRAEARFAAVVDDSPLGIIEFDLEGEPMRANRSAAAMLGWNGAGAAAPPGPLFDDATQATVAELWRRSAAGSTVVGVEVAARRRDGTPIDLSMSTAPVRGAGDETQLVVLVLTDISEQRRLERHLQQVQRFEALGRLAGGVAHDFNNLLTVILGYSEMALGHLEQDDLMRADLEAVHRAGEHAQTLTDQLLTLSRQRVTETAVLDPNEAVRSINELLRRLVGPSVELDIVLGGDVEAVRLGSGQLEQILINLVVNARDAMPDGGRVVVTTRSGTMAATNDAAVVLEVSDTGVGMDPITAQQCFDPFFTTKPRHEGTGLGLALVFGTVTQAAGDVSVATQLGVGTTFTVRLPAVELAAADVATTAVDGDRPMASGDRQGATGRILLVDDEAPVRTLVRQMLENAGYEVVEAALGAKALVAARFGPPPDLLLTDVVMPGMSGVELARRFHALHPEVPTILVSGYTANLPPLGGPQMRFLAKPFRRDELLDTVREALAGAPARAESG